MGNLTRHEAAEFLGICVRKLDELRASGAIAYVRIGRAIRFTMEDLNDYNMRCKRKGDRRVRG